VVGGANHFETLPDDVVQFSGLLDLGLVIARSIGILKDERTLLRTIENLATAASLTLGSMSKGVNYFSIICILHKFLIELGFCLRFTTM
jgi:hypothetical protein